MFVLPLPRSSAPSRRAASPTLVSALDRLFDDSFDRYVGRTRQGAEARTPAMDVAESDTAYTVVLDLPGSTREQLKVLVEGRRVTLSSDVALEANAKPEAAEVPAAEARPVDRVLYRERSAAVYARTVVLPTEVDQVQSQAKFENCVLTLTLAKKVPTGATQLSIG